MAEFDLIEKYFAPLSIDGLKDDCAVLDVPEGMQLVVSSDTSNRGDHFVEEMSAYDAARKCLRSNLSDLAASGADPFTYQLNLALPKDLPEEWLRDFAAGLAADQEEFGIRLSGGDTTGMMAGGLSVSITVMGLLPKGQAVVRGGARTGDVVFITGTLGDASMNRLHIATPRNVLAPLLRQYASAAVDISDGILLDLGHIARHSGLAARLDFKRIPLSDKGRAALETGKATPESLLTWGEDYELAITVPSAHASVFQDEARKLGVPVALVGAMEEGQGVRLYDAQGEDMKFSKSGWQHF